MERVCSSFYQAISYPTTWSTTTTLIDTDDENGLALSLSRQHLFYYYYNNNSTSRRNEEKELQQQEKSQTQPSLEVVERNASYRHVFFDLVSRHCTEQLLLLIERYDYTKQQYSKDKFEQILSLIVPVIKSLIHSEPCWIHLTNSTLVKKLDQHMKTIDNRSTSSPSMSKNNTTLNMIAADLITMAHYLLFDICSADGVSSSQQASWNDSQSSGTSRMIDWKSYCKQFVRNKVLSIPLGYTNCAEVDSAVRKCRQKLKQLQYLFRSYNEQKQSAHSLNVLVSHVVGIQSSVIPYHDTTLVKQFLERIQYYSPDRYHYVIIRDQVYRIQFIQTYDRELSFTAFVGDRSPSCTAVLMLMDLTPRVDGVGKELVKVLEHRALDSNMQHIQRSTMRWIESAIPPRLQNSWQKILNSALNMDRLRALMQLDSTKDTSVMCLGIGSEEFNWLHLRSDRDVRSFLEGHGRIGEPVIKYRQWFMNDPNSSISILTELVQQQLLVTKRHEERQELASKLR